MDVNPEKLKKMVDYIEKTQPLLRKHAETEAKVRDRAPALVDKLIEKGALDASKRDRAIESLQDPMKALDSIEKLAESLGKAAEKGEKAAELGTVEKTASAADNMKESDRVFLQGFGLL